MRTSFLHVPSASLLTIAILSIGMIAPVHGGSDPISSRMLTDRQTFSDDVSASIRQSVEGLPEHVIELDDASNMVVAEFTIQPGAVFPWHTHPGTVLISIVEGDFVFIFAEDCVERQYSAGMALVDPGFDSVHTSFNPSADTETVVIATLLGVPEEGPLTLPVDEAEGADLDERCGIER